MRRASTADHAARLRLATARATMDYLRRAAVNVPAQVVVDGLMAVVGEIVARDVKPGNRAAVLDAAKRRR